MNDCVGNCAYIRYELLWGVLNVMTIDGGGGVGLGWCSLEAAWEALLRIRACCIARKKEYPGTLFMTL